MNIIYKENDKNSDFTQVKNVLEAALPARSLLSLESVKDTFINSSYTIYAYDGEQIVAVARVLSDGYEWTLIGDIAVLPEYQRKGIGSEILSKILEKYKGHELFTYVYGDKIAFYEKQGFKRSKNAFTYSGVEDEALDAEYVEKGFYLPLGYKYENDFYPVVGDFPKGKKSVLDKSSIDIRYTDKSQDIDYNRVNEILTLAFGGHDRDINVTKGAFKNSQYYEYAYDKDKLIGCARAVSDGVSQGFILNVAIDPNYQGLQLGWNIVTKLAKQMKGQNIFLNTHPGGVGFYNRAGFRRNKTALLYPSSPDMPHEIEVGFVLPKGYKFVDEL